MMSFLSALSTTMRRDPAWISRKPSVSGSAVRSLAALNRSAIGFGHCIGLGRCWRLAAEGAVVLVEVILPRSIRGASDEHSRAKACDAAASAHDRRHGRTQSFPTIRCVPSSSNARRRRQRPTIRRFQRERLCNRPDLFRVTLRRHDLAAEIYHLKEPQKVPVVMSQDEIRRLLAMAANIKVRAMLSLAYGCGLRAGEVVRLRPAISTAPRTSSASSKPRAARTAT